MNFVMPLTGYAITILNDNAENKKVLFNCFDKYGCFNQICA